MEIRDRIKELRRVKASELVPNPKNWRRHPSEQAVALKGLLAEIGYADALIARELPDGTLQLIDGHLRAETTPDAMVPVLVLDVTEDEADKILLTLDPLAAMAKSDAEQLKALLQTVRTDSEAVEELLQRTAGPDLWEVIHPHEISEVEVAPERAAELQAKWRTARGQLWKMGAHLLLCGDCTKPREITRLWCDRGRSIRAIWTDPPYGIDYVRTKNDALRHLHKVPGSRPASRTIRSRHKRRTSFSAPRFRWRRSIRSRVPPATPQFPRDRY